MDALETVPSRPRFDVALPEGSHGVSAKRRPATSRIDFRRRASYRPFRTVSLRFVAPKNDSTDPPSSPGRDPTSRSVPDSVQAVFVAGSTLRSVSRSYGDLVTLKVRIFAIYLVPHGCSHRRQARDPQGRSPHGCSHPPKEEVPTGAVIDVRHGTPKEEATRSTVDRLRAMAQNFHF